MIDRFLETWRFPVAYHLDEDPASLVVRMAMRGSMSVNQFIRHYLAGPGMGMSTVVASDRMLMRLAIIAGVEEEALHLNAFSGDRSKKGRAHGLFRGLMLPPGMITTRKRVAPGVMKSDGSDPYVRVGWRFQALPGDPATGEALIGRCPQCSQNLTWDTPALCLCGRCGFDFRQSSPVYLSDTELVATRTLAQALGLNGDAPKPLKLQHPFAELSLIDQLPVLAWLAGFRGLLDGTSLTASMTNIHLGLPFAENWQETLRQLIVLVFRQTAGRGDDIVQSLIALFKTLPGDDLRRKVIEQVVDHAAAAAASHKLTNHFDYWRTAPYTTLPREVRPPQSKKRSNQRRKLSRPAGSIR